MILRSTQATIHDARGRGPAARVIRSHHRLAVAIAAAAWTGNGQSNQQWTLG